MTAQPPRASSTSDKTANSTPAQASAFERQQILEAVVNNTMMALFVMDDHQHCVFMNKAAEELTGYTLAETQGRPLHDVIHHKYPDGRHYPLEECPIDRAFPERNQMQGEELFVHKDGHFYSVAFTASPIRDDAGKPIGTVIEARSIVEDKAQQAALREAEERYRLASLATNDAIWDWDLINNRVLWNEALEATYGHRLDRIDEAGEWWIEHIHPDDRERVDCTIHDVIDGASERWSQEYRFRRADGSYAEVFDRGYVLRDARGRATRMISAMLDLSERKAAEHALRDSEARQRAITEATPECIKIVAGDGRLLHMNAAGLRMIEASDFESVRFADTFRIVAPEHRETWQRNHARVVAGESVAWEFDIVGLNGTRRHMETHAVPLPLPDGSVAQLAVTRDVSERKTAEAALSEANETLEALNRIGAVVAAELDLERVVQMVTDAGVELTGAGFGAFFYNVLNEAGESYMLYTLSGAERSAFENFGMPRSTAVFRPTFVGEGVVRSDDIMQDPRYGKSAPHYGMPKGHLPVRSYLAVPVTSRSGEVVGGLFFGHPEPGRFTERHERLMTGIAAQAAIAIDNARLFQSAQREIEERRRAETAARCHAEELEAVLDTTPAAILIARDPSCEEIYGNRQASELMRMPPHQNFSRSNATAPTRHYKVFGADGREVPPDQLPVQRAARGETLSKHEERVVFEDGSSLYLLGNAVPLKDDSGAIRGAVGAFIDITDRKRAEEHQRLLIDELNHRVKNSLAIVQGIAQQTFKDGAATPEARAAFEGRLAALSAAHNLLTRRNWESASIRQIIGDAVAAVCPRAERLMIDGPDLLLPPKTAVSLAMAMHELATNAVKYGSLSGPEGWIEVRWRSEDGRLKLVWREFGGPEVLPPAKRGFGTRMIERGLAAELTGTVTIDFAREGLICTVDAPLPGAS